MWMHQPLTASHRHTLINNCTGGLYCTLCCRYFAVSSWNFVVASVERTRRPYAWRQASYLLRCKFSCHLLNTEPQTPVL